MGRGISGAKEAGAGAVFSAALASMCCILPVRLGAIGLSGAVLSAFFEPLLTCESCAPGVRSELLGVPGVIDAAVSYERKVAEIRVRDVQPPGVELLVDAVEKAGYSASLIEN